MKLCPPSRAVLAALFLILPAGLASAHPHVWVTMETDVVFGPNQEITGFRHKWTFDDMYAAFALNGLDTNGDGVYREEELKPLGQTNVEALKEFDYFTYPMIGQTRLPLKEPSEYRIDYKDKLLTLTFTLPLEAPVPFAKIKEFSFSVYDPGMYVSLVYTDKTPVKIASEKPLNCQPHIGDRAVAKVKETTLSGLGENIDPSSNFGAQFAERITLDCKP
jgi:ABC-type uncharacterized transport system substrate-binding protein